jgi:hypothetical protein
MPRRRHPVRTGGRNESRRPAWRGHDDTAGPQVSQLNRQPFSYGNRGLAQAALALRAPLLGRARRKRPDGKAARARRRIRSAR